MINDFTFDTDASPENMNNIIKNINKNEADIEGLKTNVEEVGSQIGQIANDRGYSNIPIIETDILLKNTNGWCRGYNLPNSPIQNTWVFYKTVIMDDSSPWGYGFILAYDYENSKNYINFKRSSSWSGWIEYANMLNTPIINTSAVSNNLRDIPQGIYQIYEGPSSFTDFPNTGAHKYGILVVTAINRYKIYSMTLVKSSGLNTLKLDGFVDTSQQGSTIAWKGIPKIFSPIAATGITIISQNSYILDGVMHVSIAVRKTDNSNFTVGVQHSICGFHGLTLTYTKNVEFTGWNSSGNVLVGSGGVGTIFVDNGLYLIPTAVCGVLRITGTFLLE